ncbi:hypothetical protein ACFZDK_52470 [Streptomyces sp. NPDC007901]|uniref:hypothetical protein n=1 Tax=Streptomyces sp. NPDC007901 TaxID=3364785 RepID=UPI0036E9CD71
MRPAHCDKDVAVVVEVGGRHIEPGQFDGPTVIEAASAGSVEFTERIKSVDPVSRTAVVVIVAKSAGRKVFGLATAEVRLA